MGCMHSIKKGMHGQLDWRFKYFWKCDITTLIALSWVGSFVVINSVGVIDTRCSDLRILSRWGLSAVAVDSRLWHTYEGSDRTDGFRVVKHPNNTVLIIQGQFNAYEPEPRFANPKSWFRTDPSKMTSVGRHGFEHIWGNYALSR